MRVLVVEDSKTLREYVAKALRRSGYAVDTAADGEAGLALAEGVSFDVIVLDIMLPGLDGFELLGRFREGGGDAPVLFLTARDALSDRVRGLRSGADDYLVKPFELDELLARVEVLCRRRYQAHSAALTVGDLSLDTASRRAIRAGVELDLTAREWALLEYLARRVGEVVSRTDIEEHIYDDMASPMSNVVDTAIYALRRKLAVTEDAPALIHTRRGLGYVLEDRTA